eukprot:11484269-Alexandrium_andersonii.AAC.1
MYHSHLDSRIRSYYAVGGSRMSTSASTDRYGLHQAIAWNLQWLWRVHAEQTNEQCPWPELWAVAID